MCKNNDVVIIQTVFNHCLRQYQSKILIKDVKYIILNDLYKHDKIIFNLF